MHVQCLKMFFFYFLSESFKVKGGKRLTGATVLIVFTVLVAQGSGCRWYLNIDETVLTFVFTGWLVQGSLVYIDAPFG